MWDRRSHMGAKGFPVWDPRSHSAHTKGGMWDRESHMVKWSLKPWDRVSHVTPTFPGPSGRSGSMENHLDGLRKVRFEPTARHRFGGKFCRYFS